MIITRTPLRISIGGGGTDLPSYYRAQRRLRDLRRDQQVHVHRAQPHVHRRLPASSTRSSSACDTVDEIEHRIVRAVLERPAPRARRSRSSARRHPVRHRPRLVRRVHRRPAAGALRLQARARHRRRAGRGGVPHRDRRARRAGRQAGPVHRRVRRAHLLRVRTRRPRRGVARWRSRRTRCTTSRSTCCCSSPATRARAGPDPLRPAASARARATRRCSPTSSRDQGARPRIRRRAGGGRHRRASARLMHEHWQRKRERSAGHVQRRDRPLVPASGIDNGAIGGKLVGAGAGGFLHVLRRGPGRLRDGDGRRGAAEVALPFDLDGSTVIVRD